MEEDQFESSLDQLKVCALGQAVDVSFLSTNRQSCHINPINSGGFGLFQHTGTDRVRCDRLS
jgi:hypothetical protein